MLDDGKEKIFLVGASGHAKVVADVVERQGLYEIAFLVDSNPNLKGSQFFGYQVIGSEADLAESFREHGVKSGIVAIGNNSIRTRVCGWLTQHLFSLVTVVHPSAQIGRGSSIGKGTVVMAGAVINPGCSIGSNVIINSGATIDHDCILGDNVHVAPGATICGTVSVGAGSWICSGATIVPNIRIGKNSVVAAGAVITKDVADSVTAYGFPVQL